MQFVIGEAECHNDSPQHVNEVRDMSAGKDMTEETDAHDLGKECCTAYPTIICTRTTPVIGNDKE